MVAHYIGNEMSTATIDGIDEVATIKRSGSERGIPVSKWVMAPNVFKPPSVGWPTAAPPGTLEKVEVFEARESRGESLFHPYDARYHDDIMPLLFYLMMHEIQESNRGIGREGM